MIITNYSRAYSASITKKKEITFAVINEVHAYGGRFLVPVKNCWIKAENETARKKVSIAFCDVRKVMNAKKNRNYTNSVSNKFSAIKIVKMGFGSL